MLSDSTITEANQSLGISSHLCLCEVSFIDDTVRNEGEGEGESLVLAGLIADPHGSDDNCVAIALVL